MRHLGCSSGCVHELFILSDRIYRDKAGEIVEPNKPVVDDATNGTEKEDTFAEKPKASGFSAFSSLEDTPVGDDDEDGGGGGLMVLFQGLCVPSFHC